MKSNHVKCAVRFFAVAIFLASADALEAQILIPDSGDTFVSQHAPSANYHNGSDQTPTTTNLLEIKTDASTGDYNRLAYLQFDLSSYLGSSFTNTSLTLNIGPSPSGSLTAGSSWTLNLYGLSTAAATSAATLGVANMTWNNTVTNLGTGYTGFHSAAGSGVINATLLGSITFTDSGAGTIWTTSGLALDNFLSNAGSTAAFVISRTQNNANGTIIHTIYNSTSGSKAPVLEVELVPEPPALALLFGGFSLLVCYLRWRRV